MSKFASVEDVRSRFEDVIPEDRDDWIEIRVSDVEVELVGLVPSLAAPIELIEVVRAARVRRLICDKVLALYRNPDGALTIATEMGPERESRTLPGSRVNAASWPSFTDAELASVGAISESGSVSSVVLRAYE